MCQWHILAPRRGCLGNHLPLRRVRIFASSACFYGIGNSIRISYFIKKVPDRLLHLSGTSSTNYTPPAVPPCFTERPVLFAEYLHIPGNWRMPYVAEYLVYIISILISNLWLRPQRSIWYPASRSGSHLPGLSGRAWTSLSPLQRFSSLNFLLIYHVGRDLSTPFFFFVYSEIFCFLSPIS